MSQLALPLLLFSVDSGLMCSQFAPITLFGTFFDDDGTGGEVSCYQVPLFFLISSWLSPDFNEERFKAMKAADTANTALYENLSALGRHAALSQALITVRCPLIWPSSMLHEHY